MVARSLALIMLTLTTLAGAQQPGPQMPDPQAMQMQVQRIAQERPREAEAAARGWLLNVAPDLIPMLDSLKTAAPDQYWMEVGQLTVQFDVFQNLWRRDSVRAQLVGKMFGFEAQARAQQRAYRIASEPARRKIRELLEILMTQHFDLEDRLRGLEVADIERRLADVLAESQRRRDRREEYIKWAVDDIVRDAIRPR